MDIINNTGIVATAYAQLGGSTQGRTLTLDSFKILGFSQANGADLINTLISLILLFAALAAFIYLVVSGFQYMSAGGDADKATKARQGIFNAIIGLIVIILSYSILTFVTNILQAESPSRSNSSQSGGSGGGATPNNVSVSPDGRSVTVDGRNIPIPRR